MGTGRGKHYTQEHLKTLVQIRKWQEAGVSLSEVEARLLSRSTVSPVATPRPESPSDRQILWARHQLHPGVELMVQSGADLDAAQIERIVESVRAALGGIHE
jgi:DNA-binding transcriptional MerR regulator